MRATVFDDSRRTHRSSRFYPILRALSYPPSEDDKDEDQASDNHELPRNRIKEVHLNQSFLLGSRPEGRD